MGCAPASQPARAGAGLLYHQRAAAFNWLYVPGTCFQLGRLGLSIPNSISLCYLGAGREILQEARRLLFRRLRGEIRDTRVIEAMERVPREAFVPQDAQEYSYEDFPLSIGEGQTISQPFMVALMLEALEVRRSDRILEIGTGSGYQAAILAELAKEVITVERIESLSGPARERLRAQGYGNVAVVMAGDALGWPDGGPYDGIVVAAAAPALPRTLKEQLAVGGRMVIPVGSRTSQELMKVTRTADSYSVRTLGACRFVPLIGPGAWPEERAAPS